jgi:hypothetical protein
MWPLNRITFRGGEDFVKHLIRLITLAMEEAIQIRIKTSDATYKFVDLLNPQAHIETRQYTPQVRVKDYYAGMSPPNV